MRIVPLGASGNAGREIARLLTPSRCADDVVACPRRLIDGTQRHPGLRWQAEILDPDDLLGELEGMGLSVSIRP